MAYVVARPRGRWEIRESFSTPKGPRSRTLASFTCLSDVVIERARAAARTPFDAAAVARAAQRALAPVEGTRADTLAGDLLRCLSRGQAPRPGLSQLLRDRLAGDRIDDALADWIGAPFEDRGAALVDLLGLADRLPKPKVGRLTFPGLSRARLTG